MPSAPWDAETVEALNKFQGDGRFHPYTCPDRDQPGHSLVGRDVGMLVATADGWLCPVCEYRQSWYLRSSVELLDLPPW